MVTTLFAIVVALAFDRLLPNRDWLDLPAQRLEAPLKALQRGIATLNLPGPLPALLLLLPLLFPLLLLQLLFSGLIELILAIAVLYLCLNVAALDGAIDDYLAAVDSRDPALAESFAIELAGDPAKVDANEQGMVGGLMERANSHGFALMFWLLLLGPVGVAAQRLAGVLAQGHWLPLDRSGQQLQRWMEWLPARALAGAFPFVGNFDPALSELMSQKSMEERPRDLMTRCTNAALPNRHLKPGTPVRQARALLLRSLLFWFTLLALLTLFFGLGGLHTPEVVAPITGSPLPFQNEMAP